MREFDTAASAVLDDDDWTEFKINERNDEGEVVREVDCRARKPHEGLMLVTMASTGRGASLGDKAASAVDLLFDCLDLESHEYLLNRLMDRKDPFGTHEVTEILMGLVEEWGGRPTKLPTDFAPSRKSGGQKSTRRTSVST